MRDDGLDEAIRVAGGVGALARKIGISQPSVSNWVRIPAERVLSVEAATGISRTILRPDLYGIDQGSGGDVDDLDLARAQEYALLSALLARAPDRALLERLATLRGDASPLGLAHAALGEAASRTTTERVEREYFDLFIGLGRGELLPYGSYYLTGFLHERPLARLRSDLEKLGIERAAGEAEPEDHAATMRDHGRPCRRPAPGARRCRSRIVRRAPRSLDWAFLRRPGTGQTADFYRGVGALGRLFVDIETEAFALAA